MSWLNDQGVRTLWNKAKACFATEESIKKNIKPEDIGAEVRGTADTKVSAHDKSSTAHTDLRELVASLTSKLNAVADSDDTTLDQLSEIVTYIKNNKSLIENVTTSKVNVTDIINTLTSSDTKKPLSAAQGKALKALIDGLSTSKADKATTLEGYGITDGVTKNDFNVVKKRIDDSFEESKERIITWDGDITNRIVVGSYCKVSDVTPPQEIVEQGFRVYFKDRSPYIFSESDTKDYLESLVPGHIGNLELFAIIYEEAVNMDIYGVRFPEPGLYFVFESSDYVAGISFDKYLPEVLELDSLPKHAHLWNEIVGVPFGEVTLATGGDTIVADNIITGSYYKITDAVPLYEDLQNGGVINFYRMTEGSSGLEIEGDLISKTYPNTSDPFTVDLHDNGVTIRYDGIVLVIVSYNGEPVIDDFATNVFDGPGVYFMKGLNVFGNSFSVYSLKVNDYTGFPIASTIKIPDTYLPEDLNITAITDAELDEICV